MPHNPGPFFPLPAPAGPGLRSPMRSPVTHGRPSLAGGGEGDDAGSAPSTTPSRFGFWDADPDTPSSASGSVGSAGDVNKPPPAVPLFALSLPDILIAADLAGASKTAQSLEPLPDTGVCEI